MPRCLLMPLVAIVVLAAGACGDDDEGAATTTTATSSTSSPSGSSSSTTEPEPTAGWERCQNPEGFSVSHPPGWHTNDGTVVPECSQFDPEPFTVPEGTDERVAAITAFVDPVPFSRAAAPGDELDRAVTTVDGRQAVRIVDAGVELHGGAEATRYVIDLGAGEGDDGPQTLFVDTLDLSGMDYDENVEILDHMARSIDVATDDGSSEEVVARYGGGGTPFAAGASIEGTEPCITVPLEGESTTTCFDPPGSDSVRVRDLSGQLLPVLGGVAGRDVFRIDAELASGSFSYLPVPIDGAGVRAWAMPVDPDEVSRVTFLASDGRELGARTLEEEVGAEPIGSFRDTPLSSDDFPATGPPALLQDVRVAAHDGFDRVVFEYEAGDDFSYRVESVDEVSATSGREVAVEGEAILSVTMTPASSVDLSGAEPREHYTGPDRVRSTGTSTVTEVVEVEDFENVTTWAVGVGSDPTVAVDVLREPLRLVVDVAHG